MLGGSFQGHPNVVRLLLSYRASADLAANFGGFSGTPLLYAAKNNHPECIAVLAAAKASLEGATPVTPIAIAAHTGADDSIRLLAHLGSRLRLPSGPGFPGGPFWSHLKDNQGRVRDLALWERIVAKGGDEGTEKSLRKRIRMLKKAGLGDPRDGSSW